MKFDISIIIPVLNEERRINPAIQQIEAQRFDGKYEIIVVDGHTNATTLAKIEKKGIIKAVSIPGRGVQLNTGADKASGDILLFLHCDTMLPAGALNAIKQAMQNSSIQAGAFDLAIDGKNPVYRMIEKTASLRSRLTKIPYGDQAIFIRNKFFFDIGQYTPIPIMEDVDLMQKVKKNRGRIRILDLCTITSARRWQKEGVLYTTLRNWILIFLYLIGVKPGKLIKFYRS